MIQNNSFEDIQSYLSFYRKAQSHDISCGERDCEHETEKSFPSPTQKYAIHFFCVTDRF